MVRLRLKVQCPFKKIFRVPRGNACSNRMKSSGFTLIELMMTVSVLAILGTLATSSYQSVLAKGDRATAISDMVEITQALERYFSFNRLYSNDFFDLSMAAEPSFTINDPRSLYTYYVMVPGTTTPDEVPQSETVGTSYAVYARPTAKNRDKWTLSLNQFGLKRHAAPGSRTMLSGWPR